MDVYYDDARKAIDSFYEIDISYFSDQVIKTIETAVEETGMLLDEYENKCAILEQMYQLLDENNIEHNF